MSSFDAIAYMSEYVLMPAVCGAAGWVASHWSEIRRRRKEHRPHVAITRRYVSDVKVHDLLVELRIKLGATRTYITKFHNGEKFIDGDELVKKSRTHIAAKAGVSLQTEMFQNVLVSTMLDELKLVLDSGPSFTTVASLKPGRFRWMCMESGAVAIARFGIKKDGFLVGFLGADFDTDTPPPNIDLLCEYAGRVNTLLESP